MGHDKALLPWRGGTFLSNAIEALQPFTDLIIVIAGENEANVAPIVYAYAAYLVSNPHPCRPDLKPFLIADAMPPLSPLWIVRPLPWRQSSVLKTSSSTMTSRCGL